MDKEQQKKLLDENQFLTGEMEEMILEINKLGLEIKKLKEIIRREAWLDKSK